MKAKRIEISTLLRVSFEKTYTSKELNISSMTMHRMEQRTFQGLRVSKESFSIRKITLWTRKPSKWHSKTIHVRKWQNWHRIKNFQLHCVQDGRKDETKDVPGTHYWVQQWFRSVWKVAPVCWMTWGFSGMRKFSPLILSSTNRMIGS